MIFQDNNRLNKTIQKYGCNFLCMIAIVEKECGDKIMPEEIDKGFWVLNKEGYLTDICGVQNPKEVFNYFFNLVGERKRGFQIGIDDDYWVPNNQRRTDHIIGQFNTPYRGPGFGHHYCLIRENEDIIYDPADSELKMENLIHKIRYRIDEID